MWMSNLSVVGEGFNTIRSINARNASFTSLYSAASRLLQLADVVAHARAWIDKDEVNAKRLKDAYKIEVL